MPAANEDYKAGLELKAREVLEFLYATPDKGYTVMELYSSIYNDEEKSAHTQSPGGIRENFQEIQGWINEFCELGHVKKKIVSASIFFSADV
jgi:hypothetical protein